MREYLIFIHHLQYHVLNLDIITSSSLARCNSLGKVNFNYPLGSTKYPVIALAAATAELAK